MNLERYEYETGKNHLDYDFFSEGPKGIIKKGVRFTLSEFNGVSFYNLAFGDWDENTGLLNDLITTNNADTEKVLITISAIVLDFTTSIPNAIIYTEGSTVSRTRRYQMGINKFWEEISLTFDIYGIKKDDSLELFHKNVNYVAFWIRRK